jgi:serine/threonine protein kinase
MIGENRYKVIKSLGSGATANVKLVEDIVSKQHFACKIMKTDEEGKIPKSVLEDLNKEITIASNIQHPHIVNVVGAGREV